MVFERAREIKRREAAPVAGVGVGAAHEQLQRHRRATRLGKCLIEINLSPNRAFAVKVVRK